MQHEIDQIQEAGPAAGDGRIEALWQRKRELLRRLEALGTS